MNLKKAYQYLYYKIYKFLELSEFDGFWMEWRAYCLVLLLNVLIFFSIINYFTVLLKVLISFPDNNIWIYILSLIIAYLNYKILLSKYRWKKIIKDFDNLPEKTNDKGTIIVWFIIIFIIANTIFSFYLLSQSN
jgi:hypothetical protein